MPFFAIALAGSHNAEKEMGLTERGPDSSSSKGEWHLLTTEHHDPPPGVTPYLALNFDRDLIVR